MIDLEKKSLRYRITVAITLLVAILLFFLILYNEAPLKRGKTTLYLPSSSVDSVIKTLAKNGYELNDIDRFVLEHVNLPKKGWYQIDTTEIGRYFFLRSLHKMQAKTMRIVVFAGETRKEMLHRLARDMFLSEAKLDKYYRKFSRFKEGNILAGTYILARSADEETVMRYLFEKSDQKIDRFAKEHFGNNYSKAQLLETLIIASIIQKESNDIKEMPSISSVIRNRLKKGMRLQMDGTLNYGKYSHTIVTPERIKRDKSEYNTYKHKGLIPAPLSNVSLESLKAAALPSRSKYLFFVLNEKGKHVFASTYKKHLKNVKEFKIYCQEREKKKQEKHKKNSKRQKLLKKACQVSLSRENNESNRTGSSSTSIDHNQSSAVHLKRNKEKSGENNRSNSPSKVPKIKAG